MNQQSFLKLVDEVLDHLYDNPYLQTHPLGHLLVTDPATDLRGRALQRIVIDAIQALRPTTESTASSHAWRTYRCLFLRYVEVLSPAVVARQLAISERQARRTNREAVEALASVLWDRYVRDTRPREQVDAGEVVGDVTESVADDHPSLPRPGLPIRSQSDGALLDEEVRALMAEGAGTSTDILEVVDGLRTILDGLAGQHGCSVSVEITSALPRVRADRVVVRQIVLNLCSLAFRRGPGTVVLRDAVKPGCVEIAMEYRQKVLGGNARSGPDGETGRHRAARGQDDRGQPNALAVQPFAAEGDERLMVIGRLTKGEAGTLEVTEDKAGSLRVTVSFRALQPPLILVVDDNPDLCSVFRRYLESVGFAVAIARRGIDAVQLAQDLRPAAITLDVMMSTQDGWETLQILKNHPATHDIPVIICSVLREAELARFLGASELLPKPVTQPALLAALAHVGLPAPGPGRQSNS